jgi:hypothetical protein
MANLSDFKVNDVLLTYGLDMGCHKCVCTTKITEINERGIVTYDDDCYMLTTWENMKYAKDYFLYSVEQEKAMQEQCDKEYNEWREACRKQLERAEQYHKEWTEKLKRLVSEKGNFDGTHTIVELSHKSSFYRWKNYFIHNINEELQLFGVADDGDTMYISINEMCVPTMNEIEHELKNKAV